MNIKANTQLVDAIHHNYLLLPILNRFDIHLGFGNRTVKQICDEKQVKLFDLKNLIIKYLPPAKDYTLSNALLFEIFRLERDLNDHSRIEEKVLVPKMQLIEQQILGD